MTQGEVIFRPARLHREPSINGEKGILLPVGRIVEIERYYIEKLGVKEWIGLGGEYSGWYIANLYPNSLYEFSNGLAGSVIKRVQIPPTPVVLARLKTEREMHGMSRPEWNAYPKKPKVNGLPATVPCTPPPGESIYVRLDERLKTFWKSLLKKAAPTWTDAQISRAYTSLTKPDRAFTNFDSNRYQTLLCAGVTVRLVDKIPFRKYGREFYAVYTIPVNTLDEQFYLDMPLPNPYVFYAVNSTIRGDEEFPQLGGMPVPVPFMSMNGIAWVETKWIAEIL